MKTAMNILFGGWLGWMLGSVAHMHANQWQFYAVIVPATAFWIYLEPPKATRCE